jgi:hypothetical protein
MEHSCASVARLLILAGTLIVLVSFAWMGRSFHRKEPESSRP